jgi:hypothetical protein
MNFSPHDDLRPTAAGAGRPGLGPAIALGLLAAVASAAWLSAQRPATVRVACLKEAVAAGESPQVEPIDLPDPAGRLAGSLVAWPEADAARDLKAVRALPKGAPLYWADLLVDAGPNPVGKGQSSVAVGLDGVPHDLRHARAGDRLTFQITAPASSGDEAGRAIVSVGPFWIVRPPDGESGERGLVSIAVPTAAPSDDLMLLYRSMARESGGPRIVAVVFDPDAGRRQPAPWEGR